MRWEDINRTFFDAISAEYDQWLHGAHGKLAKRTAELASVRAGDVVLDVGCGTGRLTRLLAAGAGSRGQVIAIDISAQMLARARGAAAEWPNTSFYQASASPPLWFRAETFDLICICDSLAYLTSAQAVLAEARRMLRPQGRLVLAVPRRSLTTVAQQLSRQVLERMLRSQPLNLPLPSSRDALLGEPDVLEPMLATAGFQILASSAFVTGARVASVGEWLEIERSSSPRARLLLSVLGPEMRRKLIQQVEWALRRRKEEAFHHHHAFTLIVARLPPAG